MFNNQTERKRSAAQGRVEQLIEWLCGDQGLKIYALLHYAFMYLLLVCVATLGLSAIGNTELQHGGVDERPSLILYFAVGAVVIGACLITWLVSQHWNDIRRAELDKQ